MASANLGCTNLTPARHTSTNSWDARDFLDSIYYVYDLTLESN
jgi:hypothetical protein